MWSYMASALGIACPNEAPHEAILPTVRSSSLKKSDVNHSFFRLRSRGWLDRENDLYLSAPTNVMGQCNVIFFPGDVQDFRVAMETGPFAKYSNYSYETVAGLLSEKFGELCNVWLVRPVRFKHGAYSSFDNFVTTDEYGAATKYDPTGYAIKHLSCLLENAQATLRRQGVNVSTALPVHLVGFSKGGIVLNQLVTEFVRYVLEKERFNSSQLRKGSAFASTQQLFSSISSMHWLDFGNGALQGAVPTDEIAFSVLSRCEQLRLFVHVTPYQYHSMTRPWIKTEVNSFVNNMNSRGADIQLIIYYESDDDSLASHFHILEAFIAS